MVLVDPIRTKLKAPGTMPLTLESDKLLSNLGFKLNLRRYILEAARELLEGDETSDEVGCCTLTL